MSPVLYELTGSEIRLGGVRKTQKKKNVSELFSVKVARINTSRVNEQFPSAENSRIIVALYAHFQREQTEVGKYKV